MQEEQWTMENWNDRDWQHQPVMPHETFETIYVSSGIIKSLLALQVKIAEKGYKVEIKSSEYGMYHELTDGSEADYREFVKRLKDWNKKNK